MASLVSNFPFPPNVFVFLLYQFVFVNALMVVETDHKVRQLVNEQGYPAII